MKKALAALIAGAGLVAWYNRASLGEMLSPHVRAQNQRIKDIIKSHQSDSRSTGAEVQDTP
jgi:hypothetical protein